MQLMKTLILIVLLISITNAEDLYPPDLYEPEEGSTDICDDDNLEFSWSSVSGATSYDFEISEDWDFNDIVYSENVTYSSIYAWDVNLHEDLEYYWRVRAKNAETTSEWSLRYDFRTIADTVAPVLISPSDNSIAISTSPTFEWNSVTGVSSYKLQISESETFSIIIIDENVNSLSKSINGLDKNKTYYWRVISDGCYNYNYSDIWKFTTEDNLIVSKEIKVKMFLDGNWDGIKHNPIPVFCEIRSGADLNNSSLIARQPAIIDTTGNANFDFGNTSDGDYWIVVRSGGYLPLGSTSKISLSTTQSSYDFTDAESKSAGGDRAVKESNGVYLLRSGDFNFDRRVSASDVPLLSDPYGKNLRSYVPEP